MYAIHTATDIWEIYLHRSGLRALTNGCRSQICSVVHFAYKISIRTIFQTAKKLTTCQLHTCQLEPRRLMKQLHDADFLYPEARTALRLKQGLPGAQP